MHTVELAVNNSHYVLGLEVVEDGIHDGVSNEEVILHEISGSVDHLVPRVAMSTS